MGETLGMAIATVNRTLQELRASGTMDFRDGELVVMKWRELKKLAEMSALSIEYPHWMVARQASLRLPQ